MMLCKFDARPHWGKNWDRTFTNPRCPVPPKYGAGMARMQQLQAKHDPARSFEPELWTRMTQGTKYALYPRCVLDRACYCEADEHCAEGFSCRASPSLPQFNTCQPTVMN